MGRNVIETPLRDNSREVIALLGEDKWGAIRSLWGEGVPKKRIARMLGLDIKTVRRYLGRGGWQPYRRRVKGSSVLGPYEDHLNGRMEGVDFNARILYEEIKALGYGGCYEMVKLYVRPHREAMRQLEAATVRFETPPGRQSQVDWSTVKVWLSGRDVRLSLFVMALGYSRSLFARCEWDQRLPSLIRCHEASWAHFEGRTEEVLYDNPRTICLRRDYEGSNITWNPQFLDFARYYGFRPVLCRPYRARTKGKVEAGIKYVKRNFFAANRRFDSLEELNRRLLVWCVSTADERVHGTTHRKPREARGEERLISLSTQPPYTIEESIHRRVATDCLVSFESNRYSVPYPYVGKMVDLARVQGELRIYHGGELIASHPLEEGKHRVRMEPMHYQGLFRLKEGSGNTPVPPDSGLNLLWPQGVEEVEIRDLAVYESLSLKGGEGR